jgi:hypothetical protein
MNMRASRRGLSPLLAIIIGLVVTVVAGILLAQLYFSYAATISARPAANVEYVDLVVPVGSTKGILAINIKNMGSVEITSIGVTGDGVNECSSANFKISPGGVAGISCTISGVSAGGVWNGTVTVTFGTAGTQVYAISVRARSA